MASRMVVIALSPRHGDIEIGTETLYTARPQVPFRPSRLVVTPFPLKPDSLFFRFLSRIPLIRRIPRRIIAKRNSMIRVIDIHIASQSMFAGEGEIPVDVFSPEASGNEVLMDEALPGVDITVSLCNVGKTAMGANVAMFGVSR